MRLLPLLALVPLFNGHGYLACDSSEPAHAAGPDLYATYCAECHGAEAQGDGPLAAALDPEPADLTRLAGRYGMPLPIEDLADWVDGRDAEHASREMPQFGDTFFEGEPTSEQREHAKRVAVRLILSYVETLQRPVEASSTP